MMVDPGEGRSEAERLFEDAQREFMNTNPHLAYQEFSAPCFGSGSPNTWQVNFGRYENAIARALLAALRKLRLVQGFTLSMNGQVDRRKLTERLRENPGPLADLLDHLETLDQDNDGGKRDIGRYRRVVPRVLRRVAEECGFDLSPELQG